MFSVYFTEYTTKTIYLMFKMKSIVFSKQSIIEFYGCNTFLKSWDIWQKNECSSNTSLEHPTGEQAHIKLA